MQNIDRAKEIKDIASSALAKYGEDYLGDVRDAIASKYAALRDVEDCATAELDIACRELGINLAAIEWDFNGSPEKAIANEVMRSLAE